MKHQIKLLLINILISFTQSAKILGVFPYCSHSHYQLGFALMKQLLHRGHSVTFISCYPQKTAINNFTDVSVREDITGPLQAFHARMNVADFQQMSYWAKLDSGLDFGMTTTEATLRSQNVQELIESGEKFDVLILEHFMNEALMALSHIFNSHTVLVAPGPTTVFTNHLMGNPSSPVYVPSFLSGYGSSMGFWQRIRNTYYHLLGEVFINWKMLRQQSYLLKQVLPDAPDLKDVLYNASFMLVATHSLSDPVSLQRNIRDIGGYHLEPPKPLPREIEEFMGNATEGVVVFSLGSHMKSDKCFSPERRRAILKVFARLKQKVLWKFESDLEDKPDNVKIMTWLPQQEVLGHPKTVAFITHGGLLGTIEAVFHGVPILGLPVFWDQDNNVEEAVLKGMGLKLDFRTLNEQNFGNALTELLDNPSYREHARLRSEILRDQPIGRLEEAAFWIEYVARHNGANHLKSPALNYKWYQKYLLDIFMLIASTLVLLVLIVFIVFKRLGGRLIVKNKSE